MYNVQSERLSEILQKSGQEKESAFLSEVKNIAAKYEIEVSLYKKQQITRVALANSQYGEMLKKGMFTDRGRIYIKYGEPVNILDTDDDNLGKTQKWFYDDGNTIFIFILKEDDGSYRLYNISDERE